MTIAALLLAAGRSSRFTGGHKLLEPLNGEPVVVHSARAMIAAELRLVTVLGARADEVEAALRAAFPVECADGTLGFHRNPDYASGMGGSIRKGMEVIPPDASAVLLALADMPLLRPDDIRAVLAAWKEEEGVARAVSEDGAPSHPVLFPRSLFPQLLALKGDKGARSLLRDHRVRSVPIPGARLLDVDTREALERAQGMVEGRDRR